MIVKCTMNPFGNYVSMECIYPVVSYREKSGQGAREYQVFDDGGSLSYIPEKYFVAIHDNIEYYIRQLNQAGEEEFIYKSLYNTNFYENFYAEDEQSINARILLYEAFVDIFSTECSKEELSNLLKTMNHKAENYELVLKAFLRDGNEKEVSQFADEIYDTILEYDEELIEIIIDSVKWYKSIAVENLLTNLYINKTFKNRKIADSLADMLIGSL